MKIILLDPIGGLGYAIWTKLIGYLFTAIVYYWFRRDNLLFFHNLGISTSTLVITSHVLDMVVLLVTFIPAYLIR
ncbi:MAG: hypothetical protein JXQ90_21285 [Cyclobacteriaceae bacterium]